jgi:hypothetical protein
MRLIPIPPQIAQESYRQNQLAMSLNGPTLRYRCYTRWVCDLGHPRRLNVYSRYLKTHFLTFGNVCFLNKLYIAAAVALG